uniref:Eugenol O-methyltransferase n=1 Tax=Ocimum basilicum TaxID=39350 RepID=EOMT1_OCIBA|nr:RecName: Full=Eugenol O-methyltransferase; AltName: Full=(Iso)eugenol O-methyltransferase EOMT1; AltName: Full=S-adenosysl-L-methionine:(Iso)eugenol O-methyltransferase EOMT1 [Ocimum basilicum]AAL30424.1 eugenol O-methyltransferase [Ocimum basilicum]
MALQKVDISLSTEQLLQAQVHVWNHMYAFANSMSLKCAIQLGIPDILHKHGRPMTLSQLLQSIPINKEKTQCFQRLMRALVNSNFFIEENNSNNQEVCYWLTPASCLLLKEAPLTVTPLVQVVLDPTFTNPWHHMSEWFTHEKHATQFEAANGCTFWEKLANEPSKGRFFDEAMSCDSRLIAHVFTKDYKHVIEGIRTLVDVGGGNGTMAKAIVEAMPTIKCTVIDLPHVVAGLESTDNLNYIGGDMFQSIPSADAILLKSIIHDWDDVEGLKILKKCKDAVVMGGKVIIIDVVVGVNHDIDEVLEDQLHFDMAMMCYFNAKERTMSEWEKLIYDAGFKSYKLTPAFGVRSLIEAYP